MSWVILLHKVIMLASTSLKPKIKAQFKKIKKSYISLDIFKLIPKQLTDFASLSKLPKQTKYIQNNTTILLNTIDQLVLVRKKEDQEKKKIQGQRVIKICDIIKNDQLESQSYIIQIDHKPSFQKWIIAPSFAQKQIKKYIPLNYNSQICLGNIILCMKYLGSKLNLPKPQQKSQTSKPINLCDEQCTICHKNDGQIVQICQCLQTVHINCFSQSQRTNISISQHKDCVIFTLAIKCSICKRAFPSQLTCFQAALDKINRYNQSVRKIETEEVIVENQMRLICEVKRIECIRPQHKNNKVFILGKFRNNQITFGRDASSDISIEQMSVSRQHAKIIYDQSQQTFSLANLSLKFGTLRKIIQKDIEIEDQIIIKTINQLLAFSKMQTTI